MGMNQKQIIIGMVVLALLAYGAGYVTGTLESRNAQAQVREIAAENQSLAEQLAGERRNTAELQAELKGLKDMAQLTVSLDPSVADRIRRAGASDPAALLENLRQTPSAIPTAPVLGGSMMFTQVGFINEHWVYGAYEDGHIAGAAVFQWENRDSGIIWTPILVRDE